MRAAAERHHPPTRWSGVGRLRPGLLEIEGPLGSLPRHAHHSVQVAIADRGSFVIEDGDGRRRRTTAAIVPAGRPHAFHAAEAWGRVTHVEPESSWGAELASLVDEPDHADAWHRAGQRWKDGRPQPPDAMGAGQSRHPGLAAALAVLRDDLDQRPVRLRDVAAAVHLSESRLSHLFAEELGITFRAYVRWLRLLRATAAVAEGGTLTEAAHRAGFTDSSHLTRTCRRTFGSAPTAFGAIRWEIRAD